MVRYTMLNDLSRAHRVHLLCEAQKARSSATRFGSWASLLKALWVTPA